jgi:CSLREA domain-containing protein
MRKLIFSGFLALALLGNLTALAVPTKASPPIVVDTTGDIVSDDGFCSLREAIIATNADAPYSNCPSGAGVDTIEFSSNLLLPVTITLTTSGANEDNAMTGDLDISGSLTIVGLGVNSTLLDGNGTDRVFDIRPGAHVTITNLTVRHGNPVGSIEGGGFRVLGSLILSSSTVADNQAGGIYNNGGGLVLNDVSVTGNIGGYGLRNQNQASLFFNGGSVSANQGGGIYNTYSTANLVNLTISGNSLGSGVYNTGASLTHLTLSSSTIIGNSGTNGGGIHNEGVGAVLDIHKTSLLGNTATAAGGGVFNIGILSIEESTLSQNQARTGGGIDHFGGDISLINDTISSNTALDNGGGLYNRANALLTNVTLNLNTANGAETGGNIFNDTAQISMKNTLLANADGNAGGNCFNSEGFLTSLGHNFDSGITCSFNGSDDLANIDPLLGPLQDNGGPTLSHALLPGSPAIDRGDNLSCPATDQRGISRPVDGDDNGSVICDIGAYEALAVLKFKLYLPLIVH